MASNEQSRTLGLDQNEQHPERAPRGILSRGSFSNKVVSVLASFMLAVSMIPSTALAEIAEDSSSDSTSESTGESSSQSSGEGSSESSGESSGENPTESGYFVDPIISKEDSAAVWDLWSVANASSQVRRFTAPTAGSYAFSVESTRGEIGEGTYVYVWEGFDEADLNDASRPASSRYTGDALLTYNAASATSGTMGTLQLEKGQTVYFQATSADTSFAAEVKIVLADTTGWLENITFSTPYAVVVGQDWQAQAGYLTPDPDEPDNPYSRIWVPLTEGVDYRIRYVQWDYFGNLVYSSYEKPSAVGTYHLSMEAMPSSETYWGSSTDANGFYLLKICEANDLALANLSYDSSTPLVSGAGLDVTVRLGDVELTEGVDYYILYTNYTYYNYETTNPPLYRNEEFAATVIGMGDYTGSYGAFGIPQVSEDGPERPLYAPAATAMSLDETYETSLNPDGGEFEHWVMYSYTAEEAGEYRFSFDGPLDSRIAFDSSYNAETGYFPYENGYYDLNEDFTSLSSAREMLQGETVYIKLWYGSYYQPAPSTLSLSVERGSSGGDSGGDDGGDDPVGPGDIDTTPVQLELGTAVTETFANADAIGNHWRPFVFTAPADGTYEFTATGDFDTYGYLFSSYDSSTGEFSDLIVYNDDDGEGNNFLISYAMTEGQTMYLRAQPYDSSSGIDEGVQVLVREASSSGGDSGGDSGEDPVGPGDIDTTPVQLELGTAVTETFANADAAGKHWRPFVFTAPADGTYELTTTGDIDTYGYLYSSYDSSTGAFSDLIEYNDDGGDGNNFLLAVTMTEGQTVYLKARPYSDSDAISDGVQVLVREAGSSGGSGGDGGDGDLAPLEDMQPTNFNTPYTLYLNTDYLAYLNPDGQQGEHGEFFKFTAPETGSYLFTTRGTANTVAMFYDSFDGTLESLGERVSINDDAGENVNFRVSVGMQAGETKYLYVTTRDGNNANDTVRVSVVPDVNQYGDGDDPAVLNLGSPEDDGCFVDDLILGEPQSMSWSEKGYYQRIYRFVVPATRNFTFTCTTDADASSSCTVYNYYSVTDGFQGVLASSEGEGQGLPGVSLTQGHVVYVMANANDSTSLSLTVTPDDTTNWIAGGVLSPEGEYTLDELSQLSNPTLTVGGSQVPAGDVYFEFYGNSKVFYSLPTEAGAYSYRAVESWFKDSDQGYWGSTVDNGYGYTTLTVTDSGSGSGGDDPDVPGSIDTTPVQLELGVPVTETFANADAIGNHWRPFVFTAPADGTYEFTATGDFDTYGYLFSSYDSSTGEFSDLIVYNDDDGEGNNFLISYAMTEGQTMYLRAQPYDSSSGIDEGVQVLVREAGSSGGDPVDPGGDEDSDYEFHVLNRGILFSGTLAETVSGNENYIAFEFHPSASGDYEFGSTGTHAQLTGVLASVFANNEFAGYMGSSYENGVNACNRVYLEAGTTAYFYVSASNQAAAADISNIDFYVKLVDDAWNPSFGDDDITVYHAVEVVPCFDSASIEGHEDDAQDLLVFQAPADGSYTFSCIGDLVDVYSSYRNTTFLGGFVADTFSDSDNDGVYTYTTTLAKGQRLYFSTNAKNGTTLAANCNTLTYWLGGATVEYSSEIIAGNEPQITVSMPDGEDGMKQLQWGVDYGILFYKWYEDDQEWHEHDYSGLPTEQGEYRFQIVPWAWTVDNPYWGTDPATDDVEEWYPLTIKEQKLEIVQVELGTEYTEPLAFADTIYGNRYAVYRWQTWANKDYRVKVTGDDNVRVQLYTSLGAQTGGGYAMPSSALCAVGKTVDGVARLSYSTDSYIWVYLKVWVEGDGLPQQPLTVTVTDAASMPNMENATVSMPQESSVRPGETVLPNSVYWNGTELVRDVDYTVAYQKDDGECAASDIQLGDTFRVGLYGTGDYVGFTGWLWEYTMERYVPTPTELQLGSTAFSYLNASESRRTTERWDIFTFTAPEAGTYRFATQGDYNTMGLLFAGNGYDTEDGSFDYPIVGATYGPNKLGNFTMERELTAGETVLLRVQLVDYAAADNGVSVSVEKVDATAPQVTGIYHSGDTITDLNANITVSVYDDTALGTLRVVGTVQGSDQEYTLTNKDAKGQRGWDWKFKPGDLFPASVLVNGAVVTVEAVCTDMAGNKSEAVSRTFTLELQEMHVSNLVAEYDSHSEVVNLSWNGEAESYLAGYVVYRRVAGATGWSRIGSRAASGATSFTFTDSFVSENTTYEYRVEALGDNGGSADATATVAVPYAPRVSVGVETNQNQVKCTEYDYALFGIATYGVANFLVDFGDGTPQVTTDQPEVRHAFANAGTYQVNVTAVDTDGCTATASTVVEVRDSVLIGDLTVTVVDENGNKLSGFPVYFDLGGSGQRKYVTNSYGRVVISAAAGTYHIGAFMDGYLPVEATATVTASQRTYSTLQVTAQPIVSGEITAERMTLEEIQAAGIDTTDPDNQQVAKVNIEATYGDRKIELTPYVNIAGVIVGGNHTITIWDDDDDIDDEGGNGTGRIWNVVFPNWNWNLLDIEFGVKVALTSSVVAIVDIPVEVSALKEFFDVKLHIMNNADSQYNLVNNQVTLNVPEGLTLMETLDSSASQTASWESMRGGESQTITWVLRGDTAGEYDLTADYSALLDVFGAEVSAQFASAQPVKVWGLSALTLNVDLDKQIYDNNLNFNLSLENTSDIDVNLPNVKVMGNFVEIFRNKATLAGGTGKDNGTYVATCVQVRRLRAFLVDTDGTKTWLDNPDSVEVLKPGQSIQVQYVAADFTNYEHTLYLREAAVQIEGDTGLNVNINVRDLKAAGVNTTTGAVYPSEWLSALNNSSLDQWKSTLTTDKYACIIPGIERTNVDGVAFDRMVSQGMCQAEGYLLISACDEAKNYADRNNSVIYVMDMATGTYLCTAVLDGNSSHTNSMAYCDGYVYISDSHDYRVRRLPLSEITNLVRTGADSGRVTLDRDFAVRTNSGSMVGSSTKFSDKPSIVAYYNGYLYVGPCESNESFVCAYNVKTGCRVGSKIVLPGNTQSIAFAEVNGETFIFASVSSGRTNLGKVSIAKVVESSEGVFTPVNFYWASSKVWQSVTFPNMTEDLVVSGGNLYMLYEGASNEYMNPAAGEAKCSLPIDRVSVNSVSGLISAAATIAAGRSVVIKPETGQIAAGIEDNGLIWRVSAEGELTIDGNGAMADYELAEDAPWVPYADQVTTITVGTGVTAIGDNAFGGLNNVASLYVASEFTSGASIGVGAGAFEGMSSLQTVDFANAAAIFEDNVCATLGGVEVRTVNDGVADWARALGATVHLHEFSAFETVQPTCGANGYQVMTCVCGSEILANVTDPEGEHVISFVPKGTYVCTEDCEGTFVCANCELEYEGVVEAHEHSFGDWATTLEPTVSAEGNKARTCSDCGTAQEQAIPKLLEFKSIDAEGFEGMYDGQAHSADVNVVLSDEDADNTPATVKYSELTMYGINNPSDSMFTLDASPSITDVDGVDGEALGFHTVYYQVSKPGYQTVTGFVQLVVSPRKLTSMSSSVNTVTYNGKAVTPTYSVSTDLGVLDASSYTLTIRDSRANIVNEMLNAGSYMVGATGTGNYTGTVYADVVIAPAIVDAPTAVSNLVYNGSKQTGVARATEYAGAYKLTGNTATNAGTYTATATLANNGYYNYIWSDQTVAPKQITWSIAQAQPKVTVSTRIAAVNYNGSITKASYPIKEIKVNDVVVRTIASDGTRTDGPGASVYGDVSFAKVSGTGSLAVTKTGATAGAITGKVTVQPATPVGEYTAVVRVTVAASADGNYAAATKDVPVKVQVKRFAPTISILGKVARTVSYATLKTKSVTVDCPITKVQCASKPITYELSSAKSSSGTVVTSKFKVDLTTGKVTVAKGTAKGTYTVNIKVMSDDNANYKGNYKVVACTVKVA